MVVLVVFRSPPGTPAPPRTAWLGSSFPGLGFRESWD
jgi:hypothetical protein